MSSSVRATDEQQCKSQTGTTVCAPETSNSARSARTRDEQQQERHRSGAVGELQTNSSGRAREAQ